MIKKKVIIIILKATQRNPVEHREGDSSVTLLMMEVASKTLLPDATSECMYFNLVSTHQKTLCITMNSNKR